MITCGGRDSRFGVIDRRCWTYNPLDGTNKWTEIPGLRMAVSYAAAAYHKGKVYVLGGKDLEGKKTRKVQVIRVRSHLALHCLDWILSKQSAKVSKT